MAFCSGSQKVEDGRHPSPNQRKEEELHNPSYIHLPTFLESTVSKLGSLRFHVVEASKLPLLYHLDLVGWALESDIPVTLKQTCCCSLQDLCSYNWMANRLTPCGRQVRSSGPSLDRSCKGQVQNEAGCTEARSAR